MKTGRDYSAWFVFPAESEQGWLRGRQSAEFLPICGRMIGVSINRIFRRYIQEAG